METSFGRDLARSLALMLLELQAELEEFAHQVDLHPNAVPSAVEKSLSSQAPR